MQRVHGNLTGLKHDQLRRVERIARRRCPPELIVGPELARYMSEVSREIGRQIGVLINRRGQVRDIIVGDAKGLVLPDLDQTRDAPWRLKRLRLVHTHLQDEQLTEDDLTDLALLRLDCVAAITVRKDGLPHLVWAAHLVPGGADGNVWEHLEPQPVHDLPRDFLSTVQSLETEFARARGGREVGDTRDRAILLHATTGPVGLARESLDELADLASTCGLVVVDTVVQRRHKIDPRFVVGIGKLREIIIRAMQLGAEMIVFDRDLIPAQVRAITNFTELKVVDRTQVILDIFAQHAHSREGKIQVELAQLKYMLPRLIEKNTAMSRLTGGIGGRGPGESKIEINRRRARDRIHRLEGEIRNLSKQRHLRRRRRERKHMPTIAVVGYANAGKSTLLNSLTHSSVGTENKPFATLNPASRRLRFPREREAIITDTVGFIRDLPPDLVAAFRATLEELEDADLLVHLVDISNEDYPDRIDAVNTILAQLSLADKPSVLVFNKCDLVAPDVAAAIARSHEAIHVSALDTATLAPLTLKMEEMVLGPCEVETHA
jgi:GTP-binding protein HflX